jgi:inosose dehydratase
MNRRHFLKTTLLGSTALATATVATESFAAAVKTAHDEFRGLKMGMTSYTLRKYKLEEVIELTKQAGVKYISLKEVHLALKTSREQRQAVRRKIEDAGLVLLGGGVIYMKNNEAEIRNAFEYARDAGMPTIVCAPDPAALDTVEKMAKEFDLRIAIHNHGPGDSRYPSPLDILPLIKDRDPRMGICIDVGHTVRLDQDPVEVIQKCADRLYDFHMKDVTSATAKGAATAVGRGIIDIVGVLRALVKMKFQYHVALEYEAEGENPMPGVHESYAYMRGVLAALAI